jgi:hypothetical protein
VQEPVAIVSGYYGGQCVILPTEPARLFNSGTAFYTTPPAAPVQELVCVCGAVWQGQELVETPADQRQWVGLTDEEIDQGLLRSDYALQTAHAWRAGVVFAMTQLKEKNT